MSLVKWTPLYEPFLDVERALNELGSFGPAFAPALDMYEKDNAIIVELSLAGVSPNDVKISIEDNVLNIEGKAERKREVDEAQYYRKEVRTGSFHRVVSLPAAVIAADTKAEYDKGILKITMPKKEAPQPTSVEIKIKS